MTEVVFRDKVNCKLAKAGMVLLAPGFVAVEDDKEVVIVLISVLVLITVLVLVIVEVIGGRFVETMTVEADWTVVV